MKAVNVVLAGQCTTVQDLGRRGMAHLGVPRAGAADAQALRLANRLVGNPHHAAGLEITLTGCTLRTSQAMTVAVTGASAPLRLGGRPRDVGLAVQVAAGELIEVGPAVVGLRSYLAVAGGITTPPVLGSRATDTFSGLGPPILSDGDVLPVGPAMVHPDAVDVAIRLPVPDTIILRLRLGPRDGWFTPAALATLVGATYSVSPTSNRVGARLTGPPLRRAIDGELPCEGVVLGAVQVSADGQPLITLADHPPIGRRPAIGVVYPDDISLIAQARPGTGVRFRTETGPAAR